MGQSRNRQLKAAVKGFYAEYQAYDISSQKALTAVFFGENKNFCKNY